MNNYWAIAIGINQYQDQRFQSLMYAQRDAQALCSFWVDEAGFAADQCVLFTDISPAISPTTTSPSRNNICATITTLCQQQLQADDFLWCFFSGYGVQSEGRDYLIPGDGEFTRPVDTAIPVQFLFEILQSAPTDNIVLLLDISRSQGALPGSRVGAQTIELANQYNIATLLSCTPEQFSHETLGVRHGLFTAAILEGLRYEGCVTLDHLAQYLHRYLPQLSEHHWRPRQDPIAVIPAEKKHQLILPGKAIATAPILQSQGSTSPSYAGISLRPMANSGQSELSHRSTAESPIRNPFTLSNGVMNGAINNGMAVNSHGEIPAPNPPNGTTQAVADDSSDAVFWQRLRLLGIPFVVVFLLTVLFLNRSAFTPDSSSTSEPSPAQPETPPGSSGANRSNPLNFVTQSLNSFNPSQPTADSKENQPTSSSPDSIQGTSPSATFDQPQSPSSDQSQAGATLQPVREALQNQDYGKALQALDRVPQAQRTGDYLTLSQQVAQAALAEARASIGRQRRLSAFNQASDFNAAIQLARRVQPHHPYHPQAQQDIRNWSQIILELARSRASQSNQGSTQIAASHYSSAIAAARLVPSDQGETYASAQRAVAYWSQTILDLAQARAQEGRFNIAIRAAELIPPNTSAYNTAQAAIARWETQLGY